MLGTALQQRGWSVEKKRLVVFIVLLVLTFLVLISRLFYIQVRKGELNAEKVQKVIRREVPYLAPRGEIFDRNFRPLQPSEKIVKNSVTQDLVALVDNFASEKDLIARVILMEKVLGYPEGEILALVEKGLKEKKNRIVVIKNLQEEQKTLLADMSFLFGNFIEEDNVRRIYTNGPITAHITGYVGPPTRADLESNMSSHKFVGKNGIEKIYDELLRGTDGSRFHLVNPESEGEYNLEQRNFIPGDNLTLTIDMGMQKVAWKSMGDKQGAVVVLNPHTGEILALVSKPDFDPNLLIPGTEGRMEHLEFIQETRAEINRAISTRNPPASTFKPLVALTAMIDRRISSGQTHYCPGKFIMKSSYAHLPDTTFHCWDTHGRRNMITALADSCSVYFYKLSQQIGAGPIINNSIQLHLDQITGIDLPGEIAGFVPDPDWKYKTFNQRWYDGDTVNLSIGQGFIETTLIGMMNFYSAVVTGGEVYRPHLLKEVRYPGSDLLREEIKPVRAFDFTSSSEGWRVIREGLRQVVLNGTARNILNRPYLFAIAGKTGTVQTRSQDRFAHSTQHAWFIGYGPYNGDPEDQIVVGVFIERGIGGAIGAAPIAHDIFHYWTKYLKNRARSRQ